MIYSIAFGVDIHQLRTIAGLIASLVISAVCLIRRSFSYILLMAGFGYLILASFYLIIDVIPLWNGAPFRYPGML